MTNMMTIVVWKWPPVLSMCSRVWNVEDGEGGWVMSQARMLASVPDLLVPAVRHVTRHGALCVLSFVACV